MRVLIHIHDDEIASNDELTHPNWNILLNAYRLPGGMI